VGPSLVRTDAVVAKQHQSGITVGADIPAPTEPILSLSHISKRYPGVVALNDVDLEVRTGEIHAVVGENGAGKSTLIKIITGVIESDTGEIRARGVPVEIGTPRNATRMGITAVPQDILLVPELPVGRNILLGMEKALTCRETLNAEETKIVRTALSQVGASFEPSTPSRSLSVPQLRLAQIARALVQAGDVLVLDEPTAVLSEPDAEHLLERLMFFRDARKAIIYITHRLSEVMRIADRVTVLRDGKRVGHFTRGKFDRTHLVALMVKADQNSGNVGNGSVVEERRSGVAHQPRVARDGSPALAVRGITAGRRFVDVSFIADAGEIVGLAGVQGSGHGHVLRAIAGVDSRDAGDVRIFGAPIAGDTPSDAFRSGLILVPADRRGAGIVSSQSIQENIALSPRISKDCRFFGFRSPRCERTITLAQMERLSIQPRLPGILAGNLSGGNQQKVALARALCGDVRVLLIEEPTQGIDVRSRAEIHGLLRRIAREQKCALVIASSEFEELIGLVDVIHVMRLGRLVATLPGEAATYHDILHEALP
jgi:ABC-type sugar transport system ATPase subunit